MIEIFFLPANFIQTTLFLIIILYWITVLLGAIDMDMFDFDIDVDIDTDVDIDADADVESSNIYGLNRILSFFNLGKVPFMIFLTFLVLPWWFGTVILNHFFGIESFLIGFLLSIPTLIVSLFAAKILTTPFVKIFAALDRENVERDILGSIGEVRIAASDTSTGQADFHIGDAFITIQIRLKEEGEVNRGDHVMIIGDQRKEEFYWVERHTII